MSRHVVEVLPRRPVTYSEEVASAICETVATTPRGIDWLSANMPGWPAPATVHRWQNDRPEFRQALAFAKLRQAELLVYQALEIADDDHADTEVIERRNGDTETRLNFEFVARSKLKVETRLKIAGKLDPKKWGDKLDLDATIGFTRQEDALEHLR